MGFWTSIFSGRTYTKTGNLIQDDEGHTFIQCGDNWYGDNGDVVQKQGNGLMNLNTGVQSSWGDPFEGKKDEY